MRKGRRGFSLVEVVCAMTVVTIISAVTIGLISSSNRVMSNSRLAVGAANEARNIIDCYTAAVIQTQGDPTSTEDNFGAYISKLYGTTTGYAYSYDDEKKSDTYTFYYNGEYELVAKSDAIVIMKLTFPTDDEGNTTSPKITVSRCNSKTKEPEKTLFSN